MAIILQMFVLEYAGALCSHFSVFSYGTVDLCEILQLRSGLT